MDCKVMKTVGGCDVDQIKKILSVTSNNSESFENDLHLNQLVEKPWGHEYRVYCDSMYDVWRLHISSGHNTSMHCHILKDTVLICLSGVGYTEFLDGSRKDISSGDIIYLTKGLFHKTYSIGNDELNLIEVENPRNKLDLLRSQDAYGRENAAYERKSVKSGELVEIRNVNPGVLVRDFDLSGEFRFEAKELTQDELEVPFQGFYVSIDINDHLIGKVIIFKEKNEAMIEYIGKPMLFISRV